MICSLLGLQTEKEYISEELIYKMPLDTIPLKSDCIYGSIFNGVKEPEPILWSFGLIRLPGFEFFHEPGTLE